MVSETGLFKVSTCMCCYSSKKAEKVVPEETLFGWPLMHAQDNL